MRTKTRRLASAALAAFTVVVATGVGLASPADAHGACRPRVERVTRLSASRQVSCGTAQKVAAAYDSVVMAGGSFPGRGPIAARGFSCATRAVGHESEESFSVRCARRQGVVRFVWGV